MKRRLFSYEINICYNLFIISVYFWLVAGKVSAALADVPELAAEVAGVVGTGGGHVASGLVAGGGHAASLAAAGAGHVWVAAVAAAAALQSLLASCLTYYRHNEQHPRLISAMVKQILFK